MYALIFYVFITNSQAAYTSTECKGTCSEASVPNAGYGRVLGNKVSYNFAGQIDVWSSTNTRIWTTNVLCWEGQAWPRISEGITVPLSRTRGYPIRVNAYIELTRFISYKGRWVRRNHGPNAYRFPPKGPRYNGAYMWLNNPTNYHDYPGKQYPRWPFTVEVNIWNRYDNGADIVPKFKDYYDADGRYAVTGGMVKRGPITFFAYFILNLTNEGMANMNVNTGRLLKHLRDYCGMSPNLDIIEVAVAVEGHAGADGKFVANIRTMGRP